MKLFFTSKVKSLKRISLLASIILALSSKSLTFSQTKIKDTTSLEEVVVKSVRVNKKTPVSFSNMSKNEIQKRNLGQDIPILMNYMPSVVTTSDAGNGFGYTGIRVRGSDATRVNVTINGIPYNDAESSGTYFVDMPDFASSLQSIQLQRGVGTSTNGSGAFGASLNMQTQNYSEKPNAEISNSFGSFNSRKHTVKFSTGLLKNKFEIAGRVSLLKSDGYIQRASSDLKSYFFQGAYVGKRSLIKAVVFGGKEITYQSWNGIDADMMAIDRTFNYSGMYYDANGNVQFYKNEVDNYQQHHAQLIWNEKLSDKITSNVALHYTKGKGFYENFKEDADYADYNLTPIGSATTTDLARQKWLNNDFYGITYSLHYNTEKVEAVLGGAYNQYKGKHYGLVNWAENANSIELNQHYYDYFGNKNDATVYAKINYQIAKKWSVYGDLQYRRVLYHADGSFGEVKPTFNFLNPKAGINYLMDDNNTFYFSYAKANREPNRTDYENGTVNPEKLDDYELGWRHNQEKFYLNWNVYLMKYKNQILLTGSVDDIGNPIRFNTDKSYRFGTEIEWNYQFAKKWFWNFNTTLSANKIVDKSSNRSFDISYSPNVILGNKINFKPIKNLQLILLQKFVSHQYMNNMESDYARLPDYFVNDFNVVYEIHLKKIFESIVITGLVNNVLTKKYISNGYMWDIYPYYFPQAGRNYLVGLTLKF